MISSQADRSIPAVADLFSFERTFTQENGNLWKVGERPSKSNFRGDTWGAAEISQPFDVAGLANGLLEASNTPGRLGLELGPTSGIAPATAGGWPVFRASSSTRQSE